MRYLIDLLQATPEKIDCPKHAAKRLVTTITADSRRVMKGSLFAALKGEKRDGAEFIPDALLAGATAILCGKGIKATDNDAVLLHSDNPRKALAHMAAAFYGRQPRHMVAVTGTDGKTSTCDFYRQFCHGLGKSAASIGTLGVLLGNGDMLHEGSHTTPDAVELHKLLAEMNGLNITHAAMEASSHGLDQYRLDGVKLQAAAFTNIARDHLDYHKTEEGYFAAKARLFSELLSRGATAVLNQDDIKFPALKASCNNAGVQVIGFGKTGGELHLEKIEPLAHGQRAHVALYGKRYKLAIPVVGEFQVMNILAALGLVIATGEDVKKALETIPHFKGVPGRLEQVARLANGATVFIDYAHTPMALENILKTLRPHTKGKLHVVFGCGGDRDVGKRPQMGKIAATLADRIIITDDNPRSEKPAAIRKAILATCADAKEVADRGQAIYAAIQGLESGDILVIAGKGHEKTQIVGQKIMPFDDAEVARKALQELQLGA